MPYFQIIMIKAGNKRWRLLYSSFKTSFVIFFFYNIFIGISGKDNDTSSITELSKSGHYKDRADDRRKTKGSDHDSFKTEVASVELPITSQNKGFKLLSSMGWKEGDGIGKIKNHALKNMTCFL